MPYIANRNGKPDVDDLLLKDVRDVTEIRRLDALRRVADFLAARTGKFFSEDERGTVCGLSRPVAQNYLGALETLYLCPFTGIDLHTGPSTARFGDGLFAVPMASFFDT